MVLRKNCVYFGRREICRYAKSWEDSAQEKCRERGNEKGDDCTLVQQRIAANQRLPYATRASPPTGTAHMAALVFNDQLTYSGIRVDGQH